mgnify:CR=1 FL=1|jgi:hypothetical protein
MSNDCDALWLYGSYARGQADDRSDCDVLAISDMAVQKEEMLKLSGLSGMSLSISRYSWIELDSMAAYGSLFLQHLRLEGKCLYERSGFEGRLAELLSRLGPYRRASFDLKCYRDCIGDVYDSLSQASSPVYEVSVLATVIRHASILGCFLLGVPDFGRLSPVINFARIRRLDAKIADFLLDIYPYKFLADGRKVAINAPAKNIVVEGLEFSNIILSQVEIVLYEYERSLSPAYR